MALPVLPAALNTGDFVDNTWVDRVRAYHDYWGGSRPSCKLFYNVDDDSGFGATAPVTANTNTIIGATDGDGVTVEWEIGETFYSASSPTGNRITLPVTGIWRVGGFCKWDADAAGGQRHLGYTKNGGASPLWMQTAPAPTSPGNFGQTFDWVEDYAATDYFELAIRSTATTAYQACRLWVQLVSEQ